MKSAKRIDFDAKGEEKKEQKYLSPMEKIVDLPLITSANLISAIRRNDSVDSDDTNDKTAESNIVSNERCLETSKSGKKNGNISRSPAIKKTDNGKLKIPVQCSQNGAKIEHEFTGKIMKKASEVSRTESVELTLAPLKNGAEDAAESDRSMTVRGKEISKILRPVTEGRKTVSEDTPISEGRKVDGEAISGAGKFSFENSRELAGEPDGKADEEVVMEPPQIPKSPLPTEVTSPLQGEANKAQIIATEPRPSFLHGAVHSELKVKPMVPQKPVNFLAKSNPVGIADGIGKKGYVLPPPSIQNAVGRPSQSIGEKLVFFFR